MTQEQALEILKRGHNVFLTGSPGAGKTFLLNQFIKHLKGTTNVVAVTASTGIAATHMNGVTLHSWSGLGIREDISDKDITILLKRKYLFKRIRKTDVLIIDEVSMLKPAQFDAVERICRYVKANFLPFGGMQVVLSGDFFQLPPIERGGGEVSFITDSSAWKKLEVKVCYLQGQFRHSDEKLAALLGSIRENNIEAAKAMLAEKPAANAAAFAADGNSGKAGNSRVLPATKLYTHNVDVDEINARQLAKIIGKEHTYDMHFYGEPRIVETLKKSCLAPEKLVLKKGAQVMFVKNNFEEGYVNGTQGTVVDFDRMGMPIVKTLDGPKVVAAQGSWKVEEPPDGIEGGRPKIVAEITQLPLRLAWAITVHKSQGMNLDAAYIDLSKCFVKGMGYVALSRLRSFDGLHVAGINDLAFYVHEKAVELDGQLKDASARALHLLEG